MNRHAFALLCVLGLTVSLRSPAAAQGLVARCDGAVGAAETAVRQFGECSQALAKVNVQEALPPVPVIMSIPAAIKKEAMTEPTLSRLIQYYGFSAYLAGNSAVCEPLRLLSEEGACRNLAVRGPMGKELFGTNAEFTARCIQDARVPKEKSDGPPMDTAAAASRMGKVCGMIAELRAGPVDCSKLVPRYLRDEVTCRAFYAMFDGNAAACRNFKPDGQSGCRDAAECQLNRDACLDRVAYGKAYRGKDVALCGASNQCRVLMGEGQQVVQKLAAGLTNTAGRWFLSGEWKPRPAVASAVPLTNIVTRVGGFACAAPLATDANLKMMDSTLNAARTCLSDIEVALSKVDFETSQAIDAQEEKLARLRVRLDAYITGPSAAKPKLPTKK